MVIIPMSQNVSLDTTQLKCKPPPYCSIDAFTLSSLVSFTHVISHTVYTFSGQLFILIHYDLVNIFSNAHTPDE